MKNLTWEQLHEMNDLGGILEFLEPDMAFSMMIAMEFLNNEKSAEKNAFTLLLLMGFDSYKELAESNYGKTTMYAERIYNNFVSKLNMIEITEASLIFAYSILGGKGVEEMMSHFGKNQ